MRWNAFRLGAGLALLILALPVRAQNYGEIAGFVRDATGAMISGARVVATNESTNLSRTATTDGTGAYSLPWLPPGSYRLMAGKPGFRSYSWSQLDVRVEERARADIVLQIGQVEETIDVRARPQPVQRESAAVSTVFNDRQITGYPLNGRNYLGLVTLSPNAATEMPSASAKNQRQGGERAGQTISIAGQRQEFNRFTLDGVENTDVNFNTYLLRPSIDALREFKVQTGIYSAEYGRTTSQIIVTTKSGTNQFHGALFEYHRNENIDAKEWRLEGEKNPFVRNQFGSTLGGPVVKDRLFFLSNLEMLRERRTFDYQANVATDAMRAGELAGQGRTIFDPSTRTFETRPGGDLAVSAEAFPNQVIPRNRINPVARALLEFYPEATRPGEDISGNFRWNAPGLTDFEQFLQRFDYHESDGSSWFARFGYGNERLAGPRAFPTQTSRTETRVFQLAASNTRTFSPWALNEFRVAFNRFENDKVGHFAFRRDVTSELGIEGLTSPDPSAWGTPLIGLSDGLYSFGEGTDGPWVNRNHILQALDNVSIVRGRHSLKFGGEIRHDRYNHIGAQIARGAFMFEGGATSDPQDPNATGHSFADFLLGLNTQATRIAGFARARLRAVSGSFYLHDTWRLSSRLTLDLGLRYEYTPPFHDARRGIMNTQLFDPGVGPGGLLQGTRTPIVTRPGEGGFYDGLDFRFADEMPVQSGDQFLGSRLVVADANDLAPRLGLAWSPAARWTLRAGTGLFYSQDIGNARFDMARMMAGRDTLVADPERPNSSLSDPWAFSRAQLACSGWDGLCISRPFVLANIHGRRTPYVWQWMFDIQRQVGESIVLEAGYRANAGHKLERLRAFNQAMERSGTTDRSSLQSRRPWPQFGTIQEVDGVVNSNYHALSLKAESRLSRSTTFLFGYTWSKAIDNGSAIRTGGADRLFPTDNYNLAAEKGLSQFHVGHRFVASFLYDLPIGRGRRFLKDGGWAARVFGGWQIGSIVTLASGTTNTVGQIGDSNNTGTANYPDATGISPFLENPTPERFWNPEAFDATSAELRYRPGNAGRSTLIDPGLRNWDFSLLRNIEIREGQRLQFRFEAFNFSNHPNWYPPLVNARNPNTFGQVWGARPMRELQLGVKYLF